MVNYYNDVIRIIENDEWFKEFLCDYNQYMTELIKLVEIFKDDKNYYLAKEKHDVLMTMRLDSVILKLKNSMLAQSLSSKLEKVTYSGRIRGNGFFGVVIPLEKCNIEIDIQIQGKQYRHKINFPKYFIQV